MSDSYEINEHDEVVPYTSGRMCNDTRAWREATELELQQKQELKSISSEYSDYHDFASDRIAELEAESEKLAEQNVQLNIEANTAADNCVRMRKQLAEAQKLADEREREIKQLRETLTIGGNQNADLNHKNANLEAEIERLQVLCAEIGLRAVSMRPFIIGEQVNAFIEEFPEYKDWFNEGVGVK